MAAGKHLLGKARSSQIVGTAKVGEKGQIVIPKEARDLLGIRPGDTLLILVDPESGLVVSKQDVAAQILEKLKKGADET